MSIEADILRTLQQRTTAAVQASALPLLAVKYVDKEFKQPDASVAWLEIVHLPNNGRDTYWGDSKQHSGSMRLILHWPIKGGGPYKALDVLASIGGGFPKGALGNGLQITDAPDLTGVLPDAPYMLYPLTIRYTRLAI